MHVSLIGMHNMATSASSAVGGRAPGFIGAAALGPQGRRGVWVERTKSVPRRRVVVFSAGSDSESRLGRDEGGDGAPEVSCSRTHIKEEGGTTGERDETGDDSEEEASMSWTNAFAGPGQGRAQANEIDARAVYEVHSYDLRGTSRSLYCLSSTRRRSRTEY